MPKDLPSSEKLEQQKTLEEQKALKLSLMKELEELELLLLARMQAVETKSGCKEPPTMHESPVMHEVPPVEVVEPAAAKSSHVVSLVLGCPFCFSPSGC